MPKTKGRKRVTRSRKAALQVSESSETDQTTSSSEHALANSGTASDLSQEALSFSRSVEGDVEATKMAGQFRDLCSKNANAAYAASMGQYMRNKFAFFGIKAPERRQLQKQFTSEHRETLLQRDFLLRFAVALWREDERECQLYVVDLMAEHRQLVLGETERELVEAVACAEVLITTKSWWDTVDMLASNMVGYMVSQRKEKGVALMEQWITHPCMWLRRTAILHQLNYKGDTDEVLLFKLCVTVANEKEFFIRKAIGWALRQYARTSGDAVREFVETNRDSLSKLSIREALKHL